jgi:hypothetical protein
MTDERNFDRLARAWLDLMPDEAPDRTVAAVLQAIETVSQARSPWRWLPWRLQNMNRTATAVAAAAAVLAVGGALWLTRSQAPSIGGPSPTPAVTASPSEASPSAALIPEELRFAWLADVVDAPGLPADRDRSVLQIGASTVQLASTPQGLLWSDVVSVEPGAFRIVAKNATGGCTPGDVGRYTWSLSPGGTRAKLTATDDQCDSRRAAFEGDRERAACKNENNLCLGDLEAGTYQSQFIGPRLDIGERWTANYGAFSYTVSEGWSNTSDYPDQYTLMRSADYATTADARDATKDLIEVYARPAVAVHDEATCEPKVEPDTGRSVRDLIAHVTQHPGLTTGTPTDITIGGHAAQMVDAALAPSWTGHCPDLAEPLAILFTEAGPDMTDSGLEQTGVWSTQKSRFVLVDLGDGDVVLVAIHAPDPSRFDELMADAMPIVESLTFE